MTRLNKTNLLLLTCMILMTFGSLALYFLPESISNGIAQYVFILIPCFIYLIINKKSIRQTLRFNRLKFRDILIIIGITIAMRPFVALISYIASFLFGDFITQAIKETTVGYSFSFLLFTIAITPAICEEILMRGVVLDGYRLLGMKKAILLNGLLFGMLHLNLHQFAYTFVIGVILATIVYYTNSIYAGMLLHFVNNGIDCVALYLTTNKLLPVNEATQIAAQIGIGEILGLLFWSLISVSVVNLLLKKLKRNNSDNIRFLQSETRIESLPFINWSFILVLIYFISISLLIFSKLR